MITPESPALSLIYVCRSKALKDRRSASREFWEFKVSRDGLLHHLDLMSRLLDLLYPNAAKGLPTLYCIVACLCVHSLLSLFFFRPATRPSVSTDAAGDAG